MGQRSDRTLRPSPERRCGQLRSKIPDERGPNALGSDWSPRAPWTPDMAREEAKRLLAEIAKGGDPSGDKQARRHALTLAELCDRYFEDALAGRVRTRSKTAKRASTLAVDRGRIDRHIKPLLGSMSAAAVTRHDIEKFLHDVADGRTAGRTKTKPRGLARVTGGETAANRAVGLLGAIFSYAVRKDVRPDNPVRGVALFADRKRERRLSDDEYARSWRCPPRGGNDRLAAGCGRGVSSR